MEGKVYTRCYLSAGLLQTHADEMLAKMPMGGTLQQGKFQVNEQFEYRFNCDGRSIIAALARFQKGLFVCTIATSEPEKYSLRIVGPTDALVSPGELNSLMPPKGERFWP
jgi:hypothetical protein